MQSVESHPTFRRNMSPAYSGSELAICFTLVSCLVYSFFLSKLHFHISMILYVYKINNVT
jgi:hypothetical protein